MYKFTVHSITYLLSDKEQHIQLEIMKVYCHRTRDVCELDYILILFFKQVESKLHR